MHAFGSRGISSVLGGALLLTSPGCDPSFEPRSELQTLRVLAVQKDSPYAAPGDDVDLHLLWHDGDEAAAERSEELQILWTTGCYNPPADLFGLCLISPLALAEELPDGFTPPGGGLAPDAGALPLPDDISLEALQNIPLISLDGVEIPLPLGSYKIGVGERFSFRMPDDVISARPPPTDRRVPPYGLSYVFFALCAGELRFAPPDEQYPVACYSADGERMGPGDFVAGYTAVYAYDDVELANSNPRIDGFTIDGESVEAECAGGACSGFVSEESDEAFCEQAPAALTFDACPDADDCEPLKIGPDLAEEIVERDSVLSRTRGTPIDEQMWINYYVDRGELDGELRLLNDATTGWNPDFEVEYKRPKESGVVRLWAVVHDNRGGTDWVRVRLCIED